MRYHIWTIGCQMNVADSQRLSSELERLGYEWSDDIAEADVIVLNTCVVRQQAEDKVYGRLGSLKPLKERRPETVVALMGCLVGHKRRAGLERDFPLADVFLGPSETKPLIDFLLQRATCSADGVERDSAAVRNQRSSRTPSSADTWLLPSYERGTSVTAYVPIVYGCNRACSFCIIPYRRGPEHSREESEILEHVDRLVEQGIREVTLLGQIVDRYGCDRNEPDALPRLLRKLNDVDGLSRIRFLTSHPCYFTDELIAAVAELPKVMEHFEVPVQSGSDRVLELMRRGYVVTEYRRIVDSIRDRIPQASIHTDVIVGFPEETESDFQLTYDLLAELRLDKAHIAKFSPRPGTAAAKRWPDDVPAEVKERRRRALDELQSRIVAEKNRQLYGSVVEVLVEGRDRARWRGRTRTNRLVFFEDERDLLGDLVAVRIEWTGPWSMVGTAAGPTDACTQRDSGTKPDSRSVDLPLSAR